MKNQIYNLTKTARFFFLFIAMGVVAASVALAQPPSPGERPAPSGRHDKGAFPDISIAELKKLIAAKKVTIIDANSPDSYAEGHVPGAISYQTAQGKLASVLPKDKSGLVVAYCANSRCPAYLRPAGEAKQLGYTNIKHLSAGIAGWRDAGEATEK